MDDVDITLLRHVAGEFFPRIGQLCSRCGLVLDEGDTSLSWPPGEAVMASAPGGSLRVLESALRADRDRSDEADCVSIVALATPLPSCWCGHAAEVHRYPDGPAPDGCWSCSCVEYSSDEAPDG